MLNRKLTYLQVALNGTLHDANSIIMQLPVHEQIILEAGTPMIKHYGISCISKIRAWWYMRLATAQAGGVAGIAMNVALSMAQKRGMPDDVVIPNEPYIVADMKMMDRGATEVALAAGAGASAVTALGHAPIESLRSFIDACEEYGVDAMVDMMNVEYPLGVLHQLRKKPRVVIVHRGVDEEVLNKEKQIPFHEIQRIKGQYDCMVAIAGGDTLREVQRALFNDADIAVVWKSFYAQHDDTANLAEEFLKEILR